MIIKKQDSLYLFFGLLSLTILLILPAFIKSIVIKRVFQICLLSVMIIILWISVKRKRANKDKVNFWFLALLVLYGIMLYFILGYLIPLFNH